MLFTFIFLRENKLLFSEIEYLLFFQKNQSYDRNVDVSPYCPILEQSRHLKETSSPHRCHMQHRFPQVPRQPGWSPGAKGDLCPPAPVTWQHHVSYTARRTGVGISTDQSHPLLDLLLVPGSEPLLRRQWRDCEVSELASIVFRTGGFLLMAMTTGQSSPGSWQGIPEEERCVGKDQEDPRKRRKNGNKTIKERDKHQR